ncbi:twin-arginine translocation signal domain-containing protein [Mucilaginibacter humi]|uniref:twin-arginine translocation signal domain-containing protein n=1 Tax=Mucilaginibacter humi TaxID=2732510 RepID=UPI001FE6428F|nr:twin-arginine translocation signal domain-containing protein [Mucilaginibacter humi]
MNPKKPETQTSRRDFVKKSAIGLAAFTIVPRHVLGGTNFLAPSDTLTKAVVGVGGWAVITLVMKVPRLLPFAM